MGDSENDEGEILVPAQFFADLLPRIGDLAELKLTLHVLEIGRRRGTPGAALHDLMSPHVLRSVVGVTSPDPAEIRLQRALDRAVANGSLLRVTIREPGADAQHYLLSTTANRALLAGLRRGEPGAAERLGMTSEAEASIYRPNVFALYEHHIGPLTPLVAEQLRHAERSYPRDWVEQAILRAAHYSRHSWRYVEAILTRWERAGGPDSLSSDRP